MMTQEFNQQLILPFRRMLERVEIAKDNSVDDYFNTLMYFGEMFTKLTAVGLVSAVSDERIRQQSRLKSQLVRADGIGGWSKVIDDVLIGVPAQYLIPSAHDEVQQLNQRFGNDTWQYECVALLDSCYRTIHPDGEKLSNKLAAKNWFNRFTALRNKTRGHGATISTKLASINSDLFSSIYLFVSNFLLFKRGWAYLTPTMRGKYRITKWNDAANTFGFLKTREGSQDVNLEEGTYIHFGTEPKIDTLARVELIYAGAEISDDIFVPNGAFDQRRFYALSYITGKIVECDSKPYLTPVTDLPPSETQGLSEMRQAFKSIVNLPPMQNDYIPRLKPENSLYNEIVEDNEHRIITLAGRGGIGKTWLALKVLNQIANEGIFDAIIWFSARDIDLLSDGAKQVKPHILNQDDIAEEFTRLIGPYLLSADRLTDPKFDKSEFLRTNMRHCELGKILFVFDNFETVKSPGELYSWIDTYLRKENKCLITTRVREFKGDYPVELRGMSFEECRILIRNNALKIGVTNLLNDEYIEELISESGGHPYIIKMHLTELKKEGRLMKVERVLAHQDNVLDVLFERTYSRLSAAAKRAFLTLCSWKSFVAEIALEAVLLRPENEQMDVLQAVEDLYNSSLVDKSISEVDDTVFLSVPFVATQFGQRKLSVSGSKMAISADTELLRFFGAAQIAEVKRGIEPRVQALIRSIKQRVLNSDHTIEKYLPILEFVAGRYPPAWLEIAELYFKLSENEKGEEMLKRFLEFSPDAKQKRETWRRLAHHYSQRLDYANELFCYTELAQMPDMDYDTISYAANKLNALLNSPQITFDSLEKSQYVDLFISLMEKRIDEANATDCSRLAWLYIHSGDRTKAIEIAMRGLSIDPNNDYCYRIVQG